MEQTRIDVRVPPVQMTTGDLMTALRASFGPEEDVSRLRGGAGAPELLVAEVAPPGSDRRCDLLRLGLWPSRGHELEVFELKVSRSDWLKELDEPAKAEAWWPYCHRFWIVAPDRLIKPDELPPGWGLMVPPSGKNRRKFRVIKKASRREPKITAELMAAILARADNVRRNQISQLNQGRDAAIYRAIDQDRRERGKAQMSHEDQVRLQLLRDLEEALGGIEIRRFVTKWDGQDDAVTPVEAGNALRDYVLDHAALARSREEIDILLTRLGPTLRKLLEHSTAAQGRVEVEAARADERRRLSA